eukprot:Gb_04510 [translate_table: standard]
MNYKLCQTGFSFYNDQVFLLAVHHPGNCLEPVQHDGMDTLLLLHTKSSNHPSFKYQYPITLVVCKPLHPKAKVLSKESCEKALTDNVLLPQIPGWKVSVAAPVGK